MTDERRGAKPLQFSIRLMLVATAAVAAGVGLWIAEPSWQIGLIETVMALSLPALLLAAVAAADARCRAVSLVLFVGAKFCEHPMYYQEDFMFMGGIAFAYYFPVIETYIRNAPDTEPFGDHEAWILAKGIEIQFSGDNLAHVRHLKDRVVTLANFVHENIDRFGDDGEERQRVADAWCELVGHIAAGDEPA